MKHSKVKKPHLLAAVLQILVPLMLIVPNLVLDFTEIQYSGLVRATNILIPLGFYLAAMSAVYRNSISAMLLVPFMVVSAFQIVLIFLYGESVIAIDMLLNLTTSNPQEASELLSNLGVAIALVAVLYLPPLVLAVVAFVKDSRLTPLARRSGLGGGLGLMAVGVLTAVCAIFVDGKYQPSRTLFPVNVASNAIEAAHRTMLSNRYHDAVKDFTFNATSQHADSIPELYILVVGETSRADNWQLDGYDRPTNPLLSKRKDIITFPNVLTESNTTHKAVPLLLSHLDANTFGDSIYISKGLPAAFAEAGFGTAWLSNQARNRSLIDFFGMQSDTLLFLNDDKAPHLDQELIPHLEKFLRDSNKKKNFVILHTYGSHFDYKERYTPEYRQFMPDQHDGAKVRNRPILLNAYDNSICYTDALVDSVIRIADKQHIPAAVIFLSDHGEDIFDDARHRFLHASPTSTFWQLHVPFLVWTSPAYRQLYPEIYRELHAHRNSQISSSRSLFHTVLDMAGIKSDKLYPDRSIADSSYTEPQRVFLNDYDEAVELNKAGFRDNDFKQMKRHGIR